MRLPLIACVFLIAGCATATTAEYLDLKTGHQYVCYRQAAFGAIPAVVAGSAYADCKSEFERRGFLRRDARTDALLRHIDPALAETLAPPPARPATPAPTGYPMLCRSRANAASSREQWLADYRRCMAGD